MASAIRTRPLDATRSLVGAEFGVVDVGLDDREVDRAARARRRSRSTVAHTGPAAPSTRSSTRCPDRDQRAVLARDGEPDHQVAIVEHAGDRRALVRDLALRALIIVIDAVDRRDQARPSRSASRSACGCSSPRRSGPRRHEVEAPSERGLGLGGAGRHHRRRAGAGEQALRSSPRCLRLAGADRGGADVARERLLAEPARSASCSRRTDVVELGDRLAGAHALAENVTCIRSIAASTSAVMTLLTREVTTPTNSGRRGAATGATGARGLGRIRLGRRGLPRPARCEQDDRTGIAS